MTALQLPEGYTVRKIGNSLKVVPMRRKVVIVKKEEKVEFKVGQYVEKNGQIGLIQHVYAFAYKAKIGEYQSATWSKNDALTESSQAAFNAQIAGNEQALNAAKSALRQKQRQVTYRWICLECGEKHNARECSVCGSNERLHNSDADTDMSILAEVGRAEPYRPKDDSNGR